jgi:hypothetical protein
LCGEEMLAGLQWLGLEAPETLAASPPCRQGRATLPFRVAPSNSVRAAPPVLPSTMNVRRTPATWRRLPSMPAPYRTPSLPILSPTAATRTASSGALPAAPG